MTPILAEAAPDSLKQWLEVFAWLVALVAGLTWIWSMVRPAKDNLPQPLEVKPHAAVASKAEIDQLHGRIKREREELDHQLQELRAENRMLRDKLDNEINELQMRIDSVPARVIELLRSTKGLIG